jgi:hypothetical protein
MSAVQRKERLFRDIARQRRTARALPEDPDVLTVLVHLEEDLGPSVSRAFAARMLGVSHTALQRWERTGDLPVVIAPSGAREIPVPALLRLHEAVTHQRRSGRRHVVEAVMSEGRRRAEALNPKDLIGEDAVTAGRDRHALAELRSLAYHRAVAQRLDRRMVDEARQVLWRWRSAGTIDPTYADRWANVLAGPLPEVRVVLGADTPHARDLRQNSPFAGLLSETERRKILTEIS